MVSAGVSWNGKTHIHFIYTKSTKDNAESYINLLENKLLTDCVRLYPSNNFILQQDGTSSHTSKLTQKFLTSKNIEFIKKDRWPHQSPDLNPMDYTVWNSLTEKVYYQQREAFTEEPLKQKITECWQQITIEEIRKSINSWKRRLRDVIAQNGGSTDHLEH